MIRGVKFTSVPVSDQDRALAFYTEKLGFRLLTDQPFSEDQRWIELGIPGADTRIVLFRFDEGMKQILSVSHSTLVRRERAYKKKSAQNPNRRGRPVSKLKTST